ncbi:MAG: hypothetical protein HY049_09690 [Acidobacteria bacterium]|nr:hypothetical protein [Acidobacteriota bacterium]
MSQAVPRTIEIGDVVVCRDGEHARAFGVAGRVGIAVETRTSDARVTFLDPERSIWLPHPSLRRATEQEASASPLGLAAELLRAIPGTAIEIDARSGAAPSLRFILTHGAVDTLHLDDLRRRFAGRIGGWALRPAGLHRIESVVEVPASP